MEIAAARPKFVRAGPLCPEKLTLGWGAIRRQVRNIATSCDLDARKNLSL